MRNLICVASMSALVLAVAAVARTDAAADEPVPIKTVMKTLFAGKNTPKAALTAAAKTDAPDWAKVKEASDKISKFVPELARNAPPQGDRESWDKLTKAIAATAGDLKNAVEAEDVAKLHETTKAIGGSCKACHSVHRPKED